MTEPVRSLATQVLDGLADESKVYGLLHVASALAFLNRDGNSVHGGLRTTSVWVTPAGEWKLAGMEVCSRLDEPDAVMWVSLPPASPVPAPARMRGSTPFFARIENPFCNSTMGDSCPIRNRTRALKSAEAAGPP